MLEGGLGPCPHKSKTKFLGFVYTNPYLALSSIHRTAILKNEQIQIFFECPIDEKIVPSKELFSHLFSFKKNSFPNFAYEKT